MEIVRLAIVGAGGIARAVHKPAFEELESLVTCAAVCDNNPEAARGLAAELGAQAFDTLDAMLGSMADKLDGVLVTSPHHLHCPQAEKVLRHGLPVLVEKPLACNAAELRRIREAETAGGPGAFAQAGQQQRFGSEETRLKRWLGSDAFGSLRLFNLDIFQNVESYLASRADPWLLDKARSGGGITLSVAIHILDLLRYWFEDDFAGVYARGTFDSPMKNGAESTVAATLTMGSGAVGTLNATYLARRCPYSQRSVLFGTRGTLYQHIAEPGAAYAGDYYIATDNGEPTTEWLQQYSGWEPLAGHLSTVGAPSPFTGQLRAFVENIRHRMRGENSLARNANTITTIEALVRSLTSGRPEKVVQA